MGCTGDRVWASSPQGWAFRDDVQWLYLTNLHAFDLELRDEHGLLQPAKATYLPQPHPLRGRRPAGDEGRRLVHVRPRSRRESALRAVRSRRSDGRAGQVANAATGSKSTSASRGRSAASTCSSSTIRPRANAARPRLLKFNTFRSNDRCLEHDHIQPGRSRAAGPGRKPSEIRTGGCEPVSLPVPPRRRPLLYRFVRCAAAPRRGRADAAPRPARSQISADKFITKSDILVSIVRVHNPTAEVQTIYVDPTVDLGTPLEYWDVKTGSGLIVREDGEITGREPRSLSLEGRKPLLGRPLAFRFRYAVLDDPPRPLKVAGASQGRTASFAGFAKPMLALRVVALPALSAITSSPGRPRFSRRHSRSGPTMNQRGSIPCSSRPPIGPC